jgi:hypothetical protein
MFRCPRCCKAGDKLADVQEGCVDAQTIGCPPPVGVFSGKDIVLTCRLEDCGKQFAFPASDVTMRKIPQDISCPRTPCAILSVAAPTEEPKGRGQRGKAR